MLLKRMMCAAVACGLLAGAAVVAGAAAPVDLTGVQCVMAPKPASASKSVDYKKGKVYFCCNGCKGKFSKNPEKFAAKANRQLVASKQYVQKGCPLSGREADPAKTVNVAGVNVAFCCGGCQGKVASAEGEEQLKLVFSEKAFEKAFKKAEKKEGQGQ